jgi:hypothetical protein
MANDFVEGIQAHVGFLDYEGDGNINLWQVRYVGVDVFDTYEGVITIR